VTATSSARLLSALHRLPASLANTEREWFSACGAYLGPPAPGWGEKRELCFDSYLLSP
jgi:hypothetical protein